MSYQIYIYVNRLLSPQGVCQLFIGAKGRNRTADTAIFSRMLYRLSYLGKRPPRGGLVALRTGLEPAISHVTGGYVNQLHHRSRLLRSVGVVRTGT